MKDYLMPKEMATDAETIGVNKVNAPLYKTIVLAMLAGAFIALGAAFFSVVTATPFLSDGVTRLIGGICFSMGLILVIVGGAELFTGNNLIVMAWASGRVSSKQMIRNWAWVFAGNIIGSLFIVALVFLADAHHAASGQVGVNILNIARKKCELDFIPALASGVLCNILVCLAVWLSFSSNSISGKILAIVFPISAFVTLGLEHSVANLFFVPDALFILAFDGDYMQQLGADVSGHYASVTWGHFLLNLIPVVLGNIIGGGVLVGLVYWFVYLKKES